MLIINNHDDHCECWSSMMIMMMMIVNVEQTSSFSSGWSWWSWLSGCFWYSQKSMFRKWRNCWEFFCFLITKKEAVHVVDCRKTKLKRIIMIIMIMIRVGPTVVVARARGRGSPVSHTAAAGVSMYLEVFCNCICICISPHLISSMHPCILCSVFPISFQTACIAMYRKVYLYFFFGTV